MRLLAGSTINRARLWAARRGMTLVRILLGALVASSLLLAVCWTMETRRVARRGLEREAPTPLDLLIGFVTNFFDTLGIGSFATPTAGFPLFRPVSAGLVSGAVIARPARPGVADGRRFLSTI